MKKWFICRFIYISFWKFYFGVSVWIPCKNTFAILIIFYFFPFFSVKIFCLFINTTVQNDVIVAIRNTVNSHLHKLGCLICVRNWRIEGPEIFFREPVIQAIHQIFELFIGLTEVWTDQSFEMSGISDLASHFDRSTGIITEKITFACRWFFTIISLCPSNNTVFIDIDGHIHLIRINLLPFQNLFYLGRLNHIAIIQCQIIVTGNKPFIVFRCCACINLLNRFAVIFRFVDIDCSGIQIN